MQHPFNAPAAYSPFSSPASNTLLPQYTVPDSLRNFTGNSNLASVTLGKRSFSGSYDTN